MSATGTAEVFVTVGTDHHPFDRVIAWVDDWAATADERAFVQHGASRPPSVAEGAAFVGHDELLTRIRDARVVVSHGGPGTIVDCLRSGKKPIVVPRDPEHGEHVDDHQIRFTRRLASSGYIHLAGSPEEFRSLVDGALAGTVSVEAPALDSSVERATAAFAAVAEDLVPAVDPPVRVAYIGGWGRSGSTLLDRLLGQFDGVAAVGEMRDIWLRGVLENRRCGCGEPFLSCPFWSGVGEQAFGGWDPGTARELHEARMRYDRPWVAPMLTTGAFAPAGLLRYERALADLYAAIRDVSSASVIVDSTKIPSYGLLLARIRGLDVRAVHLVRDSRGVVYSWQKSVERPDATSGRDQMIRYGTATASTRYVVYNASMALFARMGVPTMRLRYEDLVEDPAGHLRLVAAFAGVDDPDQSLFDDGTVELAPTHSVDGNPMRFKTGPLQVRRDDGWRTGLSAGDRRVVDLVTSPLLLRYGYARR